MIKNDDKALVVLSGGQDSTTCLFWAKEHFAEIWAITFSYGQHHVSEIKAAEEVARIAGAKWELLDVPLVGSLGKNSNTFVPERNLFFLSIAAVYARERGIRHLVTGVGQTDFSGYPDCRDTFVKSLNVTLNLAMEEQFVIHTPLMWIDKKETWAMADELGVLDIVKEKTVTCYNGVPGDGCGHCPACKLRKHGLESYLNEKKKK